MMAFIDSKSRAPNTNRQREALNQLQSLRSDVTLPDHVDQVKDDIITHPLSATGSRYNKRQRRRVPRSYIQLSDDDIMSHDQLERGSRRRSAKRAQRHDNSDVTDKIRNNNNASNNNASDNAGLHQSSETDRIHNHQSHNNRRQQLEQQRRQRQQQQRMSASERSEAMDLMISQKSLKPPPNKDSMLDKSHRSDGPNNSDSSSRHGSHSSSSQRRGLISGRKINSQRSLGSGKGGSKHSSLIPHPASPQSQRVFPRCDLWLSLAVTQLVCIGSLRASSSTNAYYAAAPQHSGVEVAALTLSSLSFTLSFLVGVGYFHRPFREYLTTIIVPPNYASSLKKMLGVTMEQLLSLLLLLLVSIQSGLVLKPSSSNGSYLAVAGSEIWNTNLFYATWFGLYGAAYLTTATVTGMHSITRLWFMVLFSSMCASVTLLILHSGPVCRVRVLAEGTYCSSSLIAGLLGVVSVVLSFLCGSYILHSSKRNRGWGSSRTRWNGLLCASLLLVIHSIIVAVVSSPSGPGNAVGSVFLVSWFTWIFGFLLWKSCIDSFLVSPAAARSSIANLKSIEKRHSRRRVINDDSFRSGATITDDESETEKSVLNVMEEDSDGDSNSGDEDGSESTVSHSEIIHCLASLSESREDEGGRKGQRNRRHPLDPEESNGTNNYYPRENVIKYPLDAPIHHEPTHGLDASDYSTAYYSGSEAIHVHAGSQEEVSTMGGTFDHRTARSRTPDLDHRTARGPDHKDPGGMRGSMLPNRESGTLHHQSHNESPVNNSRPILREPSSRTARGSSPVSKNNSPAVNLKASQFTYAGMDGFKEWDFDTPTAPVQPVAKTHTQAAAAAARATPTTTMKVPTATASNAPKRIMRRRLSRDSFMSDFSPIQETSQESTSPQSTSPKESTSGNTTRTGSGPTTKSSSTRSGSTPSGNNKSWAPEKVGRRRKKPPPPPPRPTQRGSEKKLSNGSSADPKTVEPSPNIEECMTSKKKVARKPITPSTTSWDSVSSSSSDFDIVVSDSHSVITELTHDQCFDVPAATSRLTASAAATITASKYAVGAATTVDTKEAADNYSGYMPTSLRRQPSLSQHQAQSLPKRMPLYNGSDASSSSRRTESPSRSGSHQELRGQEILPSVETFLASAMKHARLSRSYGNMDDMPPTTDEELSDDRHQQHMHRRSSGGVDSIGSSSDREKRSGSSGRGGGGREKQRHESGSRRKKGPPTSHSALKQSSRAPSSSKSGRNVSSSKQRVQSDPDMRKPRPKYKQVPSEQSKDRYTTATSANESDSESKPSRSKSPSELLETILAQSYVPSATGTTSQRDSSMQSFFSQDNDMYSPPGEDYVC